MGLIQFWKVQNPPLMAIFYRGHKGCIHCSPVRTPPLGRSLDGCLVTYGVKKWGRGSSTFLWLTVFNTLWVPGSFGFITPREFSRDGNGHAQPLCSKWLWLVGSGSLRSPSSPHQMLGLHHPLSGSEYRIWEIQVSSYKPNNLQYGYSLFLQLWWTLFPIPCSGNLN